MTARVEALARPELLRWGRAAAGLEVEDAARKVGVKPERLATWEAGERRPTIGQLRRLANAYKRPIAVFYLPKVPPIPDPPKDFRRLPGQIAETESPSLRLEIRKATLRRKAALNLMALEGRQPPEFDFSLSHHAEPETAGQEVRSWIGVSLATQFQWKGPYDALNGWREAIERLGILVTQMEGVESEEASGFSLAGRPLPIIVANVKDFPRRRVFTFLHELVHILLRDGGLCDLDDVTDRDPTRLAVERFCNAVAGAALIPRDALLGSSVVSEHERSNMSWGASELKELAGQFAVSEEVVLRRLLDLDRTTPAIYRTKREELIRIYDEIRRTPKKGFSAPHQIAVATAGPTLAHLVLDGYAEGRITGSDASDFLGVRLKHFPKIQERISGF